MNRYAASGLGMTLGLLASTGRADDVVWRAAGERTGQPVVASAVAPPTVVAPSPAVAANLAATVGPDVTWVRVRGQTSESVAVAPDAQSLPTPVPVEGVPMPAPTSSSVGPMPAEPTPSWLPGEDPWVNPDAGAGRAPRFEVTADYLFWWTRAARTGAPLLTTSPPNGANGVPGAVPGSVVLLSAGDVGGTYRDGVRLGTTYWLDDCASYGFDTRAFVTWDRTDRFQATSNQFPAGLFRPFFAPNLVPGGAPLGEFREVVTSPGISEGRFVAENRSKFWGAEANYRDNVLCRAGCNWTLRADVLAGFRYVNLEESLTLTEQYVLASPDALGNPQGTSVAIVDDFRTQNDFYGGQVGTAVQFRRNRLTTDLRATVALGGTRQEVDIAGGQVRTPPGGPSQALLGGLLAVNSNIGQRTRNEFSVVPEVGLNVGYQVTDHIRAFVGYNFLYWSNVVRPGDQIDRVVDVNRVPAFLPVGVTAPPVFPPRPASLFHDTDFWAQGANLGLEYRW